MLEKKLYEDQSGPMEEVVVGVRVREHLVNDSQLRTTASAITVNVALTIATESFTDFFS